MDRSAISKGIMLGNTFCPDLRLYYFCRETGIPPAWGTANEKRLRPLIFLITRACGVFKIDAGEFPLRQGDCFVLFPQKGISWQSDALDPWEWLCLELTGRDAAAALESRGLAGYVYTQVSDVEEELNGLLTYDRRVDKFAE